MENKDLVVGTTYYFIEYNPSDYSTVYYTESDNGYKWSGGRGNRESATAFLSLEDAETALLKVYDSYPDDFFNNSELKIEECLYKSYKDNEGNDRGRFSSKFNYIYPNRLCLVRKNR